jgi:hypothetical protein
MSNDDYDPFSFIDEVEEEKDKEKGSQVKEKKKIKKVKKTLKPRTTISKSKKKKGYLKVDRKKGKSDLVQEIRKLFDKELEKIPIEHLRDYHLLLKALIRARTK